MEIDYGLVDLMIYTCVIYDGHVGGLSAGKIGFTEELLHSVSQHVYKVHETSINLLVLVSIYHEKSTPENLLPNHTYTASSASILESSSSSDLTLFSCLLLPSSVATTSSSALRLAGL